ncbi:helix-turn-helix protein [Saccharothrix carnea]|uniref:Helix-turn-helix protein n=1 Tax=Saccharothrix carnea TaxID=1280637 RepID=A0A2P8IFF2_SACCR|nr:helix-turn-helix protein [Saccharothrix carnea]
MGSGVLAKNSDDSAISQRRQLGAAMRSFRKEADIDRDAAAELIEVTGPTLTRKESGQFKFKRQEVETLAAAYGVEHEELAMLIELAREARASTKRGEFPMFVPVKSRAYLELERNDAVEIMVVTLTLIPPFFQTEAYMRELWLRNGELLSAARIEELVKLRQARQQVVTKRDAPLIRAVIHEFALRLPVGGPAVMREQLLALAAACELPNVEIQVQPISSGAFPSMDSTFSLLRFPVGVSGDVVQVYGHAESFYRDRQSATEPYRVAWDRRRVAALDLQASKSLILDAAASFGPEVAP